MNPNKHFNYDHNHSPNQNPCRPCYRTIYYIAASMPTVQGQVFCRVSSGFKTRKEAVHFLRRAIGLPKDARVIKTAERI